MFGCGPQGNGWRARAACTFGAFNRDPRGAVALMFALAALPLFLLTGGALDYARFSRLQAQVISLADAAALSGVASSTIVPGLPPGHQKSRSEDAATAHFDGMVADITPGFVTGRTVSASANANEVVVDVCYTARFEGMVFGSFGIPSLNLDRCARAQSGRQVYVEIYAVIDASGSMGIGATAADQALMQSTIGCTFGCHIDGSADTARANGATLRFDVVRAATARIATAMRDSNQLRELVKLNILTFSNDLAMVSPASATPEAHLTALSTMTMAGSPAGGTLYSTSLDQLRTLMRVGGDGSSPGNPQVFVLIMTDGIEDNIAWTGGSWTPDPRFVAFTPQFDHGGELLQGFNPAYCTPLKTKGATVMTLNTPYVVPDPATDGRYIDIRDTLRPLISTNMTACASNPAFAFSASEPADVQAAIDRMFTMILRSARLTQ